ncbi:TPA: hypothetical protein NJV01_003357 [Escherichia coli]|nr:hypothetical protein [Escherichia coli]HCG2937280.1 hypothetical protein [Escherichia coli]HCG3100388.1 hypothetical protein [Escherichia coli]
MMNIKQLSDAELDEIINGSVDGVYPTSQEVSMALELKSSRAILAAYGQEPVEALTITDEQIDALLDSPGNISYVIADKRERLRLFARAVLNIAAPSIPAAMPEDLLSAVEEVIRISDRQHEAWDRAKKVVASFRANMLTHSYGDGHEEPSA